MLESRKLLEKIYLPEEIFLSKIKKVELDFYKIWSEFKVPEKYVDYCQMKLDYVTAEQYLRCVNQLAYVLADVLIRAGTFVKIIKPEQYVDMVLNARFYLRRAGFEMKQNVKTGEKFPLVMSVDMMRKIQDFYILQLSVSETIVGEFEFVGV